MVIITIAILLCARMCMLFFLIMLYLTVTKIYRGCSQYLTVVPTQKLLEQALHPCSDY